MANASIQALTNWTLYTPVILSDAQAVHSVNRMVRIYGEYTGGANIKRAKLRVLVNGTSINTGSEIIIEPVLGSTTDFQVDLSDLLVNYLSPSYPIVTGTHDWIEDDNSVKEITVSIAEVTLNGTTGLLETASYKTTPDSFLVCAGGFDDTEVYNFYLDTEENIGYPFLDSQTRGFNFEPYITSKPKSQVARLEDSLFAPCFYDSAKGNLRLAYIVYSGSTVTDSGILTFTPTGNAGYIDYGPTGINKSDAGAINSNTTHYLVYLSYTSGVAVDEIKVVLDSSCTDSHTMLSFVNKFGFFDNYLFRGDKIRSTNVERTDIEAPKPVTGWVDNINENRYRVNNIRKTVTYTISSGLIKESDALYLEQLLTARYSYILIGETYIPIQVLGVKRVLEDKVKGISSVYVDYLYDVTDTQGLGTPVVIGEEPV